MPAPANVPGQIGWGQLLDTVKVQPSEILNRRANIGTKANNVGGGRRFHGLVRRGEEAKGGGIGRGMEEVLNVARQVV